MTEAMTTATNVAIGTGVVVIAAATAKAAGILIGTGFLLCLGFWACKKLTNYCEYNWASRASNINQLAKEHTEGIVT